MSFNTKNQKNNGYLIPTIDVFSLACAAQRINTKYVKDSHNYESVENDKILITHVFSNKQMVRDWISTKDMSAVTDADKEQASIVQSYWQLRLFNVFNDTANAFEKAAIAAANSKEIQSRDFMLIGLIASLPHLYEKNLLKDKITENKQQAELMSSHFGRIGDQVVGKIKVIDCIHSQLWNCYFITGQIDCNMVRFSYKSSVELDQTLSIKGKIKKHCENNVTQLNYVKLSK